MDKIPSIAPLHDHVLVRKAKRDEKTKGGIYIPATAKDGPHAVQGTVLAVGPGRVTDEGKRIEPSVKKGDQVLFRDLAGCDVHVDGEEFVILREYELLGVID